MTHFYKKSKNENALRAREVDKLTKRKSLLIMREAFVSWVGLLLD
jgi:hypothetical protein